MKKAKTQTEFKNFIKQIKSKKKYKDPLAFGIARVDRGQLNSEKILQANYAVLNWNENLTSAAVFMNALKECDIKLNTKQSEQVLCFDKKWVKKCLESFEPFIAEAKDNAHKNIQVLKFLKEFSNTTLRNEFKLVFLFADEPPCSVESVYMKLYALSLRKAEIGSLNLDGAFSILENVAWSLNMPIELEWLRANEIELKLDGSYPVIDFVDKFPRFLQHIIPDDNIRILDSSKVRMGAYLAKGTTVMPGASYVNFNAGTKGAVMVEGRISSSASVNEGSDIGGGASILGVLSGTNANPVSIGKNTLLGANSVTGVPLGDACVVDAGVAILEGTKVFLDAENAKILQKHNPNLKLEPNLTHKALNLAKINNAHFRQDSQSGQILLYANKKQVALNQDLH